jgi:hypothetical protein
MADITIEGLNRVLRALRDFPPEAAAELRDESQAIANNLMVPSFRSAAMGVDSWGPKLAASVRAKRDRVPSVSIGYARKVYSGGASSVMLRFPTHAGYPRQSHAPFVETDWIDRGKSYKDAAMTAWGNALERVVWKWNRGLT